MKQRLEIFDYDYNTEKGRPYHMAVWLHNDKEVLDRASQAYNLWLLSLFLYNKDVVYYVIELTRMIIANNKKALVFWMDFHDKFKASFTRVLGGRAHPFIDPDSTAACRYIEVFYCLFTATQSNKELVHKRTVTSILSEETTLHHKGYLLRNFKQGILRVICHALVALVPNIDIIIHTHAGEHYPLFRDIGCAQQEPEFVHSTMTIWLKDRTQRIKIQ